MHSWFAADFTTDIFLNRSAQGRAGYSRPLGSIEQSESSASGILQFEKDALKRHATNRLSWRLLFKIIAEVGQAASLSITKIHVATSDRLEACPTFLSQLSLRRTAEFDPDARQESD